MYIIISQFLEYHYNMYADEIKMYLFLPKIIFFLLISKLYPVLN